jgi:hypothetical protein
MCLSDVSGMTGQAIVKAILAGERNPYQLAALRNWRVKASEEEIAQSGRQLAGRSAVCVAARAGWLRVLPEADGRMRSAASAISPAARGPKPGSRSAGREAQGTAQEEKEGECTSVRPARGTISHDRDRILQYSHATLSGRDWYVLSNPTVVATVAKIVQRFRL